MVEFKGVSKMFRHGGGAKLLRARLQETGSLLCATSRSDWGRSKTVVLVLDAYTKDIGA